MLRKRALLVVLALVGLFFVGIGVITLYGELWRAHWLLPTHNEVTAMFASVYFTLGIFVLLALKDPRGYRILILFAAWSSLVHAAVMAVQGAQASGGARRDFIEAVILFGVIGVVLLALAPEPRSAHVPAAVAGA